MRSDIYRRIVFLIDEHHTWIKVDNANQYDVCDVKLAERRVPCVCRTLALRSLFRYGQYPKGSIWQIPERELDLALNKLRKNNKGFAKRLKQGAENISYSDVNALVQSATYGIINLELSDYWHSDFSNNQL